MNAVTELERIINEQHEQVVGLMRRWENASDRARKAEQQLGELRQACGHICGQEPDGTWSVYADSQGEAIRQHVLPVIQKLAKSDRAW